jgi:hypothetical protein
MSRTIAYETTNGPQQVDAAHPLPVAATVNATASATATTAAPSYGEGTTQSLSMDLAGNLRIGGTISASSSMRSTTAAPSYVNGTDNSLSSNLTGDLRTIAKIAASQSIGIDQGTPGTTNAVAATNLPTAVDVNSGNLSNSTQRVCLATNSVAVPLWGHGTTGAAVPANATYVGMNVSGNLTGLVGTANGLKVDGSAVTQPVSLASVPSHAVTNAGTFAVQVSGVAQGSSSSGQTVTPIGARTLAATPTDTTAQTNTPVLTLGGAVSTMPYGLLDNGVSGLTAAMTSTTSTAVTGMGAPGASLFNYITQITVGNSHATVGTFVELQDGSGGTTFYTIPAAAVYGGATITFPKPLKQPTANTGLFCKNTTTGANVILSASGFKAL